MGNKPDPVHLLTTAWTSPLLPSVSQEIENIKIKVRILLAVVSVTSCHHIYGFMKIVRPGEKLSNWLSLSGEIFLLVSGLVQPELNVQIWRQTFITATAGGDGLISLVKTFIQPQNNVLSLRL